jgi:hypothetical protein
VLLNGQPMRAGVVHASSDLLREYAPSKAAAEATVERAITSGVEGGAGESGGGERGGECGVGGEGGVASAPPATPSTNLTVAPSAALTPSAGGGTTSASPTATPATAPPAVLVPPATTVAAPSAALVPAAALATAAAAAPSAALVPTAVPTADSSTALVPAARAALVAAAKEAKATAEAGAGGKKAKAKVSSAAVCQALRDALQRVEGPRELLDPVDCLCAISTARRTYHELVTGKPPSSARANLLAADGAPWPSAQPEPPGGYGLYATGLDGSDPLQVALAKFLLRYAAQAIVRCIHRSDAPLVLFKPTKGSHQGRLCLLMCATSYSNKITS